MLKPGGRLAISDIVTEVQLPESDRLQCRPSGPRASAAPPNRTTIAAQIEAAGLKVVKVEDNPAYQFISDNARGASKKFGVKSISLLAVKP